MTLKKHHAIVCGILLSSVCAFVSSFGQEEEYPLEELSASQLLERAEEHLSLSRYDAAVPLLTEYLERMKEVDNNRVLTISQGVRFKISQLKAFMADAPAAVEYLQLYMDNLPLYRPLEALKMLAVNQYQAGMMEACVESVTLALTRPEPKGLPGKKAPKKSVEDLSEEERGGLSVRQLKRYRKQAEDSGEDLNSGISTGMPDPEPDYSLEELVLLNMTQAEAFYTLGRFEESLAPYGFVVENAQEEQRVGHAVLQSVNALVTLKRFDDARNLVLKLNRSDARFDIRVNMAIMKTAAAVAEVEGQNDSALLLYRMVLPREELLGYQERKMNVIRRDAGLPEVTLSIVTNDNQRAEIYFGQSRSDTALQKESSGESVLSVKPMSLIDLEEQAAILASLHPYEMEVSFREGMLYAESKRPWEAVTALGIAAELDAGGEIGMRAFAESLHVLIDPLEKYDRVEKSANEFLKTNKDGLAPRLVAHALTACYQKQTLWEKIRGLRSVTAQFSLSGKKDIRRYDCELDYMQATADLMLLDYPAAKEAFSGVMKKYPVLHRMEEATYWYALSIVFMKDYETALPALETYLEKYKHGMMLSQTVFYTGICLFGMDRLDEAQERFSKVIETWPESPVYSDACSMRGDLFAADGRLDEAQRDYEEAIASARNEKQDAYAVFQMARMFDLEARYDEMVAAVQAYLERRGDDADVAKAAYWIGKAKLAQGLTDEALDAYLDVIVGYGGNILQDGVDLIISELVKVARRLENIERDELLVRISQTVDAAENETLKLRLMVLRAKINGTELELGKQLIAAQSDLTQAPPPVLATICEASFEAEDYSLGEEILSIFLSQFEDSDFTRSAYKLRVYDLYARGEPSEAQELVAEAQARYGTTDDMKWAQLMKGRLEQQVGEFELARKSFRDVFNVRGWRGVAYAEAAYALGGLEEQVGDTNQAFAWYQRTYTLYKGYAGGYWAAEAYLSSARCLDAMDRHEDTLNTYRAMLYDKYVNTLPQAESARTALGHEEVLEIESNMAAGGVQTNLSVSLNVEVAQ